MRELCKQQRNEEWFLARKGRITASNMDKVLANKGTKGRHQYLTDLILDLENIPDFRDDAPWFEAGRVNEEAVLLYYMDKHLQTVEHTGFVLHPTWDFFGCSPDGLVGDDGMVEAKYRSTLKTFHDACVKPISRAYMYQIQSQMICCERRWVDYVNYWRSDNGLKEQGHVQRIEFDPALAKEAENAVMAFWGEVFDTYKARAGVAPIFPWDRRSDNHGMA